MLPKVLVISGESLFAEGICALLENCSTLNVVGSAKNAEEAVDRIREQKPDVLLVDTGASIIDSEHTVKTVRREMDSINVLLVGSDREKDSIFRGLKAGAKGYVLRTEPASVLFSAILDVNRGGYFISSSATNMMVDEYRRARDDADSDLICQLTGREKEVLALIAEGYSSREIADELHITVKTAMGYRSGIKQKLNIRTTSGLIVYAFRKNMAEIKK